MDRLDKIIGGLVKENPDFSKNIPHDVEGKRAMMRSLMNIRRPQPASPELLRLQDEELKAQLREKGVVKLKDIKPVKSDSRLRIWQGDITRLEVDAIVNAANSALLGCFIPLHRCIDNVIHSSAGIQLREECYRIMQAQGHAEITGKAKITNGYNLPARYIIHTVGPFITADRVSPKQEILLADCYRSSLELADEKKLTSVAFCCISTGEFHFPNDRAAEIAVQTVTGYLNEHKQTTIKTVIFNVFKDKDLEIYQNLLP